MNLPLKLNTEQENELAQLAIQFNQELEDPNTPPFPEMATLQTLKAKLKTTLLEQKGVAELWAKEATNAETLCLSHEKTAIRNLPWQIAIEDRPQLVIAKSYKSDLPTHQPTIGYPLKVLVMVASPEGVARLAYEVEELQLLRAFAPLMAQGLAQVHFTDDGSLENLAEKLSENKYHILHFTGHGSYHKGHGTLALEDPVSGKLKEASAVKFNEILRKGHRPELVVLSACQTAQGVEAGDLSGVADTLLQGGIPAVIAMSASILDSCAIVFAAKLYAEIFADAALPNAFNTACFEVKKYEIKNFDLAKNGYSAGQWLIPQLLLGQEISLLANENLPKSPLNLEQDLKYIQAEKALANFRIRAKNHVFFGRRNEKRIAQLQLREGKSILLRGQGGVGKSTLAEHLAARMLASNPRFKVFTFSEKTPVGQSLLDQIQRYLTEEKEDLSIISELVLQEKQTDKFLHLLKRVSEYCDPIFIFDNVETFQKFDTEKQLWLWRKERHEDILQFMQIIDNNTAFPLIITGRYPIAEFPELKACNLNTIPHSDFFRKCIQLNFRNLAQKMPIGELNINLSKTNKNDDTLTFINVINLLHKTFGGNYRALEFFDELYTQKGENIFQTLNKLADFASKLAEKETKEGVLSRMSENLVFEELLAYLEEKDKDTLFVLAQFNISVLPMAIGMQRNSEDRTESLDKAVNLTLVERQTGTDGRERFYVIPLVRDLIREAGIEFGFEEKVAGDYHVFVSEGKISENKSIELVEAFERYFTAVAVPEINDIGWKLCNFYYKMQQFRLSLSFGLRTEEIAKEKTKGEIVSEIGLLLHLFGDLDKSLVYSKRALADSQKEGQTQDGGVILCNIGQVYHDRGDYDKALENFNKALEIHETTKSPHVEVILNNISQIHHGKGEYAKALKYLKESLKLRQENGNRLGESITLNNISQIHRVRKDYSKSLECLEKALRISQEMEGRREEAVILSNISIVYEAKGEYQKALKYLERGLKISQEIGDEKSKGITLGNIGHIYKMQGDYKISLNYFAKSLKILQNIDEINGMAITLWNIGGVFIFLKKFEDAIIYTFEAHQIFSKLNYFEKKSTENDLKIIRNDLGKSRYQRIIRNLNQKPIQYHNHLLTAIKNYSPIIKKKKPTSIWKKLLPFWH